MAVATGSLQALRPAPSEVQNLEEQLKTERETLERQGCFDPSDQDDARRRILGSIVRRQGQGSFRDALLGAYKGRCAATGCDVAAALEAAHLRPYLGPQTNHVQNGNLLRAHIHTLFDLDLLSFDPGTLRVISRRRSLGRRILNSKANNSWSRLTPRPAPRRKH